MKRLTKIIPKKFRLWARELPVISTVLHKRTARRNAATTKCLEECLRQFVAMHRATGFDLQDKVCLEVGAGWVLSHALAMYVLGAKKVISTDVSRLAFPDTLSIAVHDAAVNIDWDELKGLGDVGQMKQRLEKLLAIDKFTFKKLADLGIEYSAPVNISAQPLGENVDFIYSHAVLEHVPTPFALPLIQNLASDLTECGAMFHLIHLEDHESKDAPFAFFSETARAYTLDIQSARGNRIRRSGWTKIFSSIDNTTFTYLNDKPNIEAKLPKTIDESVEYVDEIDLRSAHLTVWLTKQKS